MLRATFAAFLLLAACATTAPVEKTAAEPPPPLGDRYEIKFPGTPRYERGTSASGQPMHHFTLLADKVEYSLAYATLPGFRDTATPKSTQAAVEAEIKQALSTNGIRILASEEVTLTNADFAKTFVGTHEGQTVAGLACASGDRLYVLITQLDQSVAAQQNAAAAFKASFRP